MNYDLALIFDVDIVDLILTESNARDYKPELRPGKIFVIEGVSVHTSQGAFTT